MEDEELRRREREAGEKAIREDAEERATVLAPLRRLRLDLVYAQGPVLSRPPRVPVDLAKHTIVERSHCVCALDERMGPPELILRAREL